MTDEQIHQLAEEIACDLFTRSGERAARAHMVDADQRYLAGWSEPAVRVLILTHLWRALGSAGERRAGRNAGS